MDGRHSVERLWNLAVRELGDRVPSQGDTIKLLGQLHALDILQCDLPPDTRELLSRHERSERLKWKQRIAYPLALRFPLFDPEPLLRAWLPVVAPLFTRTAFVAWFAVVVFALMQAGSHWNEITDNVTERVLSTENLLLLWLTYPLVKTLHELGHAFAVKRWGGEVHEIGIMLLVLFPVPYVEASASSAFRSKWQRVTVGAAGILVELLLAALALLVWLNVESGTVKTLAYNVMLIGGVSTVLFNGNPLLRFDGYYVLADLLEIPNLALRSKRYLGYLVQRRLFGVDGIESPVSAPGEAAWLAFYGIAAFVYRLFIIFFIMLLVAGKYFAIGVLLAIWALTTQMVLPLYRLLKTLFTSPQLTSRRPRAVAASLLIIAGLAGLLFLVPFPHAVVTEGVVQVRDRSQLRVGGSGTVGTLLTADRQTVSVGQPLLSIEDPLIDARVEVLRARLDELQVRKLSIEFSDLVAADLLEKQAEGVAADLQRTEERRDALQLRSPESGTLLFLDATDLVGRYMRRGELVGYVLNPAATRVSVVIDQADIGLVQSRRRGVEVLKADWHGRPQAATVLRETPAATDRLPSRVLGSAGGGRFVVDPRDPSGLTTLDTVFQLDLLLPEPLEGLEVGRRVHVRFDLVDEPVGYRLLRALRQLLLGRFGV